MTWGSRTACYLGCSVTTGARPPVVVPLTPGGQSLLKAVRRGRAKREKEAWEHKMERAHTGKRKHRKLADGQIYTSPPDGWPALPPGFRVGRYSGKVYNSNREHIPCPRCGQRYIATGGKQCHQCGKAGKI